MMDKNNLKIQEDAKSDWMKIVNKHKKRQKGLPALSKLNTNAGNVEHNIHMFNMMQPSGDVSVDASNGNTSAGMSEELVKEDKAMNDEVVVLHYENLPIEVVTKQGNSTGYYDYGMGQRYPDEDTVETLFVSWNYNADKQAVIECLQDMAEVQVDLKYDQLSDIEYDKALLDNFDILVDRYNNQILAYFEEDAIADAQENFSYEDEYIFEESCEEHPPVKEELDDKFDMSMRTLL